jgi:hypothetical protein
MMFPKKEGELTPKKSVMFHPSQGQVISKEKRDVSQSTKAHKSSPRKNVMFLNHKGAHVKGKSMVKRKVRFLSLRSPLYDKSLQLSRLLLETTHHHLRRLQIQGKHVPYMFP